MATYFDPAVAAEKDSFWVVMTSNAACASPAIVTSNKFVITLTTIHPSVTAAITSGAQTICAGASVTFTATPNDGGTAPFYRWKKNNNDVGSNSATYTDAALSDKDSVWALMYSSDPCALSGTPPAASNKIVMTVNIPTAILTQPAAANGCAGPAAAPVTLTVAGVGTALTYQ